MVAHRAHWPEIARLLRAGATVQAAADQTGAHWNTARLVADRLEAGIPLDVPARTLERLDRNREIRRMAKSASNVAVAAHFGVSESMIRKVVARAAEDQIVMCEPVVIATRPAVAAPAPVVVKPEPVAVVKRSKKRPVKSDPLFLRCSRKHPITKSNRVQGTLNECLVCKRRGVALPSNLAAARDARIAELLETIAREVDELTADLRPELAVAS